MSVTLSTPVTVSVPVTTDTAVPSSTAEVSSLTVNWQTLNGNVTAQMILSPVVVLNGVPQFAPGPGITFSTVNLAQAALVIPSIAALIAAADQVGADAQIYTLARQADIAAAERLVTTAQSLLATDQAAVQTLVAAQSAPPTDAETTAIAAAWATVTADQIALQTAQTNLNIAIASLDPANPVWNHG